MNKIGCLPFKSKTMDDLKIEKFYCTRLLDISLAKITLNIANNRGCGINHTFNLINELYRYILYLYKYNRLKKFAY